MCITILYIKLATTDVDMMCLKVGVDIDNYMQVFVNQTCDLKWYLIPK